jgi:hypothetical protein
MSLPTDRDARNELQIWDGFIMYFPDIPAAVADVSVKGNKQHNLGQKLHWNRDVSTDHMNKVFRHMLDHGTGNVKDTDGTYHLAKAIWRLSAELQLTIEAEAKEANSAPKAGIRDTSQPIPADVIQRTCKCGKRVFAYRNGDLLPQVRQDNIMHGIAACGE